MVKIRILIEGAKVQNVGYRIFLLERALWNGIEHIYVRNIGRDSVELLLSDEEAKINVFCEAVQNEKPRGAAVKKLTKEPYQGSIKIPPIDRYFQFLTLEQLSRGREEVLRLPKFVGNSLALVASAINGIDKKFGDVVERFGIFGDYARGMDKKLTGIDDKLKGIDEKLDKISTLPEKIDALPEGIANALNSGKKK